MALEISLRPPFASSRVLRAQKNVSRQHWVGQAPATRQQKTERGYQGNKPQRNNEEQGYRSLAKIKLGEVEDAYKLFKSQLIPAGENWVGKHCFCTIPLKRIRDGRPPEIFGRIKTCFPSDGYIENIEELELLFPHMDGSSPDKVRIYNDDISQYSQKPAQSYYIRVQFKASVDDMADFDATAPLFSANGFHPEYDCTYFELLEMSRQTQAAFPRLYVIGSRWYDSIPNGIHAEVRTKLLEMLQWGKRIFNYHPDWLPKEINTLNRVLGFKYEFTKALLAEPATPQETAFLVSKIFDRDIFPVDLSDK